MIGLGKRSARQIIPVPSASDMDGDGGFLVAAGVAEGCQMKCGVQIIISQASILYLPGVLAGWAISVLDLPVALYSYVPTMCGLGVNNGPLNR